MNTFGHAAGSARPRVGKEILVSLLLAALLFATWPQNLPAYQDAQAPAQAAPAPPYTRKLPSSCSTW